MSDLDNAQAGASVAPVENAAEQQTQAPSESTTEQVGEQQQEQARDEKGRFVQQRINELTGKWRQSERTVEDLKRQLNEALARNQPQAPTKHQDDHDTPPSISEFSSVDEWNRANARWYAQRDDQRIEQRLQQIDQQRQQAALAESFGQKEAAYAAANPDYLQRVDEMNSVVQWPREVLEVLASSDHGPAVAHYLANHLDEADRISRLPAHIAAAEVTRIEGRVSAPKPAKPVSNAPEPAPKVGGAAAAPRGLSDDISIDEWMKRRSAKS